ncbi:MAG TPA: hypothetical protein VMU81_02090 [Acetobacteraceae bacterium]|nr:hypothetical protein [Acetobacteraceae bacterium]
MIDDADIGRDHYAFLAIGEERQLRAMIERTLRHDRLGVAVHQLDVIGE